MDYYQKRVWHTSEASLRRPLYVHRLRITGSVWCLVKLCVVGDKVCMLSGTLVWHLLTLRDVCGRRLYATSGSRWQGPTMTKKERRGEVLLFLSMGWTFLSLSLTHTHTHTHAHAHTLASSGLPQRKQMCLLYLILSNRAHYDWVIFFLFPLSLSLPLFLPPSLLLSLFEKKVGGMATVGACCIHMIVCMAFEHL